jgi:hypothetical protein
MLGATAANAAAADGWLPTGLPDAPGEGPVLCRRDYLSPEAGAAVLAQAREQFTDRSSWEAYRAHVRVRMREAVGLDPWPRRTPLHAVMRDRRTYDGYTVENVSFESIPGYIVTGNLYLPLGFEGPRPAVLHPHGHSGSPDDPGGWSRHGRFKEDVQRRAATLARMGAVSLTLDMYGYGDSIVFLGPNAHRHPVAMTMQLWNAIRALDFLEALPEVDPGRLAVTGHSGGGTQAFFLAALDDRVAASVPVAMVSAHFFGGCDCESGLPLHRGRDHFVNNAMIAAFTAPRPQLIISNGGDWTRHSPETEYPFLQHIYGLYGKGEQVGLVHLPDEGHDYGPSKRMALYPFLAAHLGPELERVLAPDGSIDESAVVIEDPVRMRALTSHDPRLERALTNPVDLWQAIERLQP